METVLQKLGENLKQLRLEAGLSQEKLSERADVDRTLISSIEHGKKLARIDTLVKLARGLGTPLSTLLDGVN